MLEWLKQSRDEVAAGSGDGVDSVIVQKVDRLVRDKANDVQIMAVIKMAGAEFISVSETIDETLGGKLMYGAMASLAE